MYILNACNVVLDNFRFWVDRQSFIGWSVIVFLIVCILAMHFNVHINTINMRCMLCEW